MKLFVGLVCAISSLLYIHSTPVDQSSKKLRKYAIHIINDDNPRTCTDSDISTWSISFDDCFTKRKIGESEWSLTHPVDRILQVASNCVTNYSLSCRPDYKGFQEMMRKVLDELQDFSKSFQLEMDYQEEEKIKLDCIDTVLSYQTYATCFESVFDLFPSQENFLRKVEIAISCTEELNKLCSIVEKTSLNIMVRTVLGVRQPQKDNLEIISDRAWKQLQKDSEINESTTPTSPPISLPSSPSEPTPYNSSTPPSPSPPSSYSLPPSSSLPSSSSLPPSSSPPSSPSLPPSSYSSTTTPSSPSTPPSTSSSLPFSSSTPTSTSTSSSSPPPINKFSSAATKYIIIDRHIHDRHTEDPPVTTFQRQISTTPPPRTTRWYDFIVQPIVRVWNWFKSLFG